MTILRSFLPRTASIAWTVLLAAGCADYTPAPINPAASAAAFDSRRLTDPRLRVFVSNIGGADTERSDAPDDLTGLTLAALYFHPEIEIGRARAASAQAAIITASQRRNPTMSLTPTFHSMTANAYDWTVGLLVDLVVETAGKREYRISEARQLAAAARLDLATAAWQVRGRVRTAMMALWTAETRRRLLDQRLAHQGRLVGLLERRFADGETSALDVARERMNLQQISLASQEATRQAEDARMRLAAAVGVPARALEEVTLSLATFDDTAAPQAGTDAGELRRQALLGRTDVRGLLAEYEAAQAKLQLAVAQQYPNLLLGPGYTFDQGDNQYTLGVGAEVPVFHRNRGLIAEAEAQRQEAAARFTALQARIAGEIDRSTALYRTATTALITSDALRAGAEQRYQRLGRSYTSGEVDRTALITAELELAAIELARFDLIVQQRDALGMLEDALQRPLFDPAAALFKSMGMERLAEREP
jgi:outer membrane protein TolC